MKKLTLLFMLIVLGWTASAQVDMGYWNDTDTIYDIVDEDPMFPGGLDVMIEFVQKNKSKSYGNRQGMVIISFIVEKDGSLKNVTILKSPSEQLSAETIRLVEMMPKWIPGRKRGNPVRVRYNLPIIFK